MYNQIGCCLALIFGIVLGIAAAVLFALTLIPFITVAAWIVLALSVGALLVLTILIVTTALNPVPALRTCLRQYGFCTLLSAVLSLTFAIIALAIALSPLNLFAIALVFLGAAAFGVMAIAFVMLLSCILSRLCRPFC